MAGQHHHHSLTTDIYDELLTEIIEEEVAIFTPFAT